MNEMNFKEFDGVFGKVRTLEEDGLILFCGSDVAKALGYVRPNDAIKAHCRSTVKRSIPHPQNPSKQIKMSFITEGDVYRLITHSKLPAAEQFEKWVFEDVIPCIRKTGGYVNDVDGFLKSYLPGIGEDTVKVFTSMLDAVRAQMEADKPAVIFAKQVNESKGLLSISDFAKVLHGAGIDIGERRLFAWLRGQKILMKDNTPYQIHIQSGRFKVREKTYSNPVTGDYKLYHQTYITGKGQIWLTELVKNEYTGK